MLAIWPATKPLISRSACEGPVGEQMEVLDVDDVRLERPRLQEQCLLSRQRPAGAMLSQPRVLQAPAVDDDLRRLVAELPEVVRVRSAVPKNVPISERHCSS